MDNNQDKYTNYTYTGDTPLQNSYYAPPQGNNNYGTYEPPADNYPDSNYNRYQNGYSDSGYGLYQNGNNPYAHQAEFKQAYRSNIDGFCIAAMSCGIMSIPMAFCYGFGIVFSIIAFIMRGTYRKRHDRHDNGMSKAGLITGIIGCVVSVLYLAFLVFFFVVAILEVVLESSVI